MAYTLSLCMQINRLIMNQETFKEKESTTFESCNHEVKSANEKNIMTDKNSKLNHVNKVFINYGLCNSCCNSGECIWEENNKIHCEHYQ